uniref:solute carrier family 35 member G1-like n=1 Tax=Styela clava TaxID=7725 RepID=UPI001939E06C|nr:solute carrier family 35 member G1-like [Styela clava]
MGHLSESEMNESNNNIGSKILAESSENKSKRRIKIPHIGILYGLLSSVFFSFNALLAKLLSLNAVQIASSRCFIQYIFLFPYLIYKEKMDGILGSPKIRPFLWLRGFCGSVSGMLFYLAVRNLSVGNAVTLAFLDCVLCPILGRIFLKESLTVMDYVFALIAFSGVILIAQPPFIFPHLSSTTTESAFGVICALVSALMASSSYLSIRKIGTQTHYLIVTWYYSIVGCILDPVILIISGQYQPPCLSQIPIILLLTASGFLGQVTLTLALQHERAGTVAVLLTLQIIVVYFVQVVFLNDIPSMLSIIGTVLIFCTSIGIGARKIINERRRRVKK